MLFKFQRNEQERIKKQEKKGKTEGEEGCWSGYCRRLKTWSKVLFYYYSMTKSCYLGACGRLIMVANLLLPPTPFKIYCLRFLTMKCFCCFKQPRDKVSGLVYTCQHAVMYRWMCMINSFSLRQWACYKVIFAIFAKHRSTNPIIFNVTNNCIVSQFIQAINMY